MTLTTAAPALHDPPAAAARYQRRRLWCGIVGIGLVLNFLWWGTFLGLTRLPAAFPAWPLPIVCALTALVLAMIVTLLQLPVDLYAQRVERAFGQSRERRVPGTYVARSLEWVVAVGVGGAALGVTIQLFRENWPFAAGLVLGGIGLAHVAFPLAPGPVLTLSEVGRHWLERVRAELASLGHALPRVAFYDHGERSLAGGWHGTGPWRTLMLTTTMTSVPPRLAAGLILREIAHRRLGHRLFSIYASLAWTVLGFALAGLTAPAWTCAASDAGLVVWAAAFVSTWNWLGLFVWPSVGRRQILAADAFAARAIGRDDALAMLDLLADRNLPDETLPPVVAWVFHPIPPMATRRAAIRAAIAPTSGESR